MVLSNAERQRRYRQRLKAKVRGDDLPERVAAVINEALAATWAIAHREGWADFEEFTSLDDYVGLITTSKYQKHNGHIVEHLREMFIPIKDEGTDEERASIDRALEVLDAVTLRLAK